MNRPARESELRADIEQTRERLSETVEQLAHKADIPARTKEKAREVGAKAEEKAREVGAKAEQAANAAVAKLPQPARQKAAGVVGYVSARPLPVVGGLVVLLWLVVRLTRRRSQ